LKEPNYINQSFKGGRYMTFFDEFKNNILEISETVGKKSSDIIEVQKLKVKKSSLESERKKDYIQLGQLMFKKINNGEISDPQAKELYDKIKTNKEATDEIGRRIIMLKGVCICPNCQEVVSSDDDFCPKCGAKIEKPVKPEVVDDDNAEDYVEEECTTVEEDEAESEDAAESSKPSENDNNQ